MNPEAAPVVKPSQFVLRTSKRSAGKISIEFENGSREDLAASIVKFFARAELEGFEALSFSILRIN
jgi:hypothetical protein